jgi:DNA-binding NarL/FixJ family response regulator
MISVVSVVKRSPFCSEPIIRIVLADNHPLVVEGLNALLSSQPDMRVVATATDGERLLEAIRVDSQLIVFVVSFLQVC